jgi:hypothetical protein
MEEEEYNDDYNENKIFNNYNNNYNNNNNNIGQINYQNYNYINNENGNNQYYDDDYDNRESQVIQTNTNKNTINKVNQLYNLLNLYDNISLYNHKNEKEQSIIRTNNIINLLVFILSGFNIKLKESPNFNNIFSNKTNIENNISKLNLILKFLNSKFLIKNDISSEEYILLTIYYIDYFDLFKNIIDFLKNKQNDALFSWNNLYLCLNDEMAGNNNEFKKMELIKSNSVLESYNKLHFIISNIKKQLDTLINQIFKLNEIKINQSLGRYKLEEILLL